MHRVLRPGAARLSFATSKYRVPAVKYLSLAVELLDPGYPERAKAIAFLSYLSLTRRPGIPDAATASARELTAQALEAPGLDPNIGAVLRLLAGMTANPESAPGDLLAAVSHLSQGLGLARNLRKTDHPPKFAKALPAAILGTFRGLLSNPRASSPSLDDQDAADAYDPRLLRLMSERGLLAQVADEMPELARVAQIAAPPLQRGQAASERLTAAFLAGDLPGVDAALTELEQQLAELASDHEFRWMLLALIGAGWRSRGTLSGLVDDSICGLQTLVNAMDQAAACPSVTELVEAGEWTARKRAAWAAAQLGWLTRDPDALTAAMRRMSQLSGVPGMTPGERAELSGEYGMALMWRHDLTRDPRDLDRAITRLREATRIASLVHCGCHANVAPSLAESHLLLAERRPLPIAEILAQAQRHDPASPGFLAVLSACLTDLADADHDEALTLASALLAAGACAVIGARWPTDDCCTAPMMVMFHHFLNNDHPHPADALRAAQLWMLDRAKTPLPGLPPELADAFSLGRFLTAPHAWAAFTCHGT